jgi:Fe-S cluster biogenesis protein NfuA
MSQTDPDRPQPQTQLRLHAERTGDPNTIRFVIAALGWSPDGRWTPEALDGCPGKLAQLLQQGHLARLEVRGEQALLTRCPAGDEWATLAPACRTAILEEIEAVDDLTRARNIVARSTGEIALSHGGGLRIVSLTDNAINVAMDGSCRGCPASERTLRDGVLHDLRHAGINVDVLHVAD